MIDLMRKFKIKYLFILNKLFICSIDPEGEAVDKYGFSASYWAKENGHCSILKILPPVKKMSKEEYYSKIQDIWAKEGKPGGGKKGGKKKGGGKKKK